MIKAGVPGAQCAQRAAEVTGNTAVASLVDGVSRSVRNGNTFSDGFSDKLPDDFRQSWCIAEETGTLDTSVGKLADNYAESAEFRFRIFARWFPIIVYFVLMIFMIFAVFRGYAQIYGGLMRQV